MTTTFTWFEKITRIYESIESDNERWQFAEAVILYGTHCLDDDLVMPELHYPVSALFESVKDDIFNSVRSRHRNCGGRPKKTGGLDEQETGGFEDLETPGFDECETGGFDFVDENGNPLLYKPKPKPKPNPSKNKNNGLQIPYADIIDYLNDKAGTHFKASSKSTQGLINGRWRDGYRLDEFKHVIDVKCAEWLPKKEMRQWLRPKTLFAASNFESYLQQTMKEVASYDKYDR